MILPIYLYGQPVLRQEADDVDENYPDLKANQNFLELQAQLEGTENRINVARTTRRAANRSADTADRNRRRRAQRHFP